MVLTPEVAYQFNTLRARPALTGLSRTCRKLESNASPSQGAQTCLGGARTADLSDQRMIMGTCLKKASALVTLRCRALAYRGTILDPCGPAMCGRPGDRVERRALGHL